MRRLQIILYGSSRALRALGTVLQEYGHQVSPTCEQPDVLIEDGSGQAIPATPPRCLHLGLRLCLEPGSGNLPRVQWQCWAGTAQAQRLVICQALAAAASGNGEALRASVEQSLLERMSLEITRFSRDPQHFAQRAVCDAAGLGRQQGLDAIEALAFEHRLNQNNASHLLGEHMPSLLEQLHASLRLNTGRTALQLADRVVSYAQLQQQAAAIRAALPAGGGVIGV